MVGILTMLEMTLIRAPIITHEKSATAAEAASQCSVVASHTKYCIGINAKITPDKRETTTRLIASSRFLGRKYASDKKATSQRN